MQTNFLRNSLKTSYFNEPPHKKPGEGWINLGDNENGYTMFPHSQYPKNNFDPLKEKYISLLRKIHPDLSPDIQKRNILFGSGSDFLIDVVLRTFFNSGDSIALTNPTFFLAEYLSNLYDLNIIKLNLQDESLDNFDVQHIAEQKPKMIFICQPNSPIGNRINDEIILWLINNYQNGIVFIDEAYQEFGTYAGYINLVNNYSQLIVSRTFSKALGGAGIRMGALFSHPDLLANIQKTLLPYAISSLTLEYADTLLNNPDTIIKSIDEIKKEKHRLITLLRSMKIFKKVRDSSTNFIFLEPYDLDACKQKLEFNKIFVRYFPKVSSGGFRVSVGSSHENNLLLSALRTI